MTINDRWVLPVAGAHVIDVWDTAHPGAWFVVFAAAGSAVHTVARGTFDEVDETAGRVVLATGDGRRVWYAGLEPASVTAVRGTPVEAGVMFGTIRAPAPGARPQLGLVVADASGRPVNPYVCLVGARDPLTDAAAQRDPVALNEPAGPAT